MSNAAVDIITNDDYQLVNSKQTQVKDIVDTELNRIRLKQTNMDTEKFNEERMILLNESYRDKQKQYIFLLVSFIVTFGICLALVFFQERLGYTSFVMDILIFLVVASGLITAFTTIQGIFRRDEIDFSRIKQNASNMIDAQKIDVNKENKEATKRGDISTMYDTSCRGAECCGPGYSYNNSPKKCVVPTPSQPAATTTK